MTTKLSALARRAPRAASRCRRAPPRSRSTACGMPRSSSTTARSRSRSASRSPARARTSKGSFFNGDEKVTSTSGSFENGALTLNFDELRHEARGDAEGRPARRRVHRAARAARRIRSRRSGSRRCRSATRNDPVDRRAVERAGGKSSKGEAAWQLIVRQSGAEVSAAILRVDGDTGTLTGTYRDGKFVLSHFSGARPLRLELTPAADGTLAVVQNTRQAADRAARGAGATRRGCRSRAIRRASPA